MKYGGLPTNPTWEGFINKLVDFISNGNAAVTFFFVHSGFVLSLSLERSGWGKGALTNFYALTRLHRQTRLQALANDYHIVRYSVFDTGFCQRST